MSDLVRVANNLTTIEEGYALDARQGKILMDRIKTVFPSVAASVSTLSNEEETNNGGNSQVSE